MNELQMYACKTKVRIPARDFAEPWEIEPIASWQTHTNLHRWMQDLCIAKGGDADEYASVTVRLDAADIDALEVVLLAGALPRNGKCFFGESRGDHKEADLAFVHDARQALRDGYYVYYKSAW